MEISEKYFWYVVKVQTKNGERLGIDECDEFELFGTPEFVAGPYDSDNTADDMSDLLSEHLNIPVYDHRVDAD